MSSASLNVSNFVTLRLRPENYPLWHEQVLALAESQELTDFLTGEKPCPAAVLPALDEEALSHVIGLDTSAQVWAALKEAYAQSSQERQFQLNQQLTLGARYEPFTTSMLKPPMPSYNVVIPLLQSYETRLNLHSPESSQYTAFYADKNVPKYAPKNPKPTNNFSSKGRGFIPANQPNKNFNNGSSSNASRRENHRDITGQICGKKGHPAIRCFGIDTSASAHMTSNEGNLYNLRPYTGNDHVMLGNGEFLKVTHTGDALLGFGQSAIVLRNVLLDKLTQQVLMRGLKRGNLYAIRAPLVALFSSRFRVASEDIWHQRLGHVQAAAHSDYFTQPAEEELLPTPNTQLKTTITIGDLVSGSHSITADNPS
ncbi:hypothetical protein Pint_11324 [Pistacia integerrima]|uniref:Uncharacterized protein n=1 Tax=Pistacia integerrima TaxID=434235 RepID=A0ACC0XJW4_9ROSI|nr:hypothetical protein Pint_11324 [Pistacia integerrima]